MTKKTIKYPYMCPAAEKVPLQCDKMYALNQFYNEVRNAIKSGKVRYYEISGTGPFRCHVDPETCPRYIEHLLKNIKRYKLR